MAVLAIYAQKHWMDEATPKQLARVPQHKIDARFRVGDIMRVLDDDAVGTAISPDIPCVYVRITRDDGSELPLGNLGRLAAEDMMTVLGETVVRKRRRYHVDWSQLPGPFVENLLALRKVDITLSQFKANLTVFDKRIDQETSVEPIVSIDELVGKE